MKATELRDTLTKSGLTLEAAQEIIAKAIESGEVENDLPDVTEDEVKELVEDINKALDAVAESQDKLEKAEPSVDTNQPTPELMKQFIEAHQAIGENIYKAYRENTQAVVALRSTLRKFATEVVSQQKMIQQLQGKLDEIQKSFGARTEELEKAAKAPAPRKSVADDNIEIEKHPGDDLMTEDGQFSLEKAESVLNRLEEKITEKLQKASEERDADTVRELTQALALLDAGVDYRVVAKQAGISL